MQILLIQISTFNQYRKIKQAKQFICFAVVLHFILLFLQHHLTIKQNKQLSKR